MKTNSGTLAPLEVKPLAVADTKAYAPQANVPSEIVLRNEVASEAPVIEGPLVLPDRFAKANQNVVNPADMPVTTSLQARFDRAAAYHREMPLVNRRQDDFEDLENAASKAGLSVEEFIEHNQLSVKDNRSSAGFRQETSWTNRDTLTNNSFEIASIARECMQPISLTNAEMAVEQLKELLRARLEARDLQIEVPPLAEEQREALQLWLGSHREPMSDLAKQILSRFH